MPSSPTSGALAIDSIGPTEAKVTPIITGRRRPTPGKPTHCTNVASPQANRSALIRKATSSGGNLRARPMIKGTATAPAYITSNMLQAEREQGRGRQDLGDRMGFGTHERVPLASAFSFAAGSNQYKARAKRPCFSNKACP